MTTSVFDGTASVYDIALAPLELAGLARLRRRLVAEARGTILEIGAGTGVNFAHYSEGVRVYALDQSREMLETARRRSVPHNAHAHSRIARSPRQLAPEV